MKNDKSFNLQLYSGDKEHKQKKKKEKGYKSHYLQLCVYQCTRTKTFTRKILDVSGS